jgi:hypothetical protein
VHALDGWGPVATRLGAIQQILKVYLQVLGIRGSRLAVYARRGVLARAPIGLS